MNKLITFSILCLTPYFVFAQTPTIHNDPHWQLVWEDHFNSFDNTRWDKSHYCDHGGEPQLYLDRNVWVSNGNLVIQVKREEAQCPNPAPPVAAAYACGGCGSNKNYDYTSGWVELKGDYRIKYGYIEARIKVPRKNGLHSSFWTFINETAPPHNAAEIDIFEISGGDPSNTITTNIHTCYKCPVPEGIFCNPNCEFNYYHATHSLSNFDYTGWHTYGLEWDRNKIIWYIDGKPFRTTSNHGVIDNVNIIFNISVDKVKNPPTSLIEYMYVDYVKVYSLKCDGNKEAVNEIPNFNTYNYAVKKSITMSNATTIPSGNIHLRATDFIELKPGFEVPLGKELFLDVSPCEENKVKVSPNRPKLFLDTTLIRGYLQTDIVNARLHIYDAIGTLVKYIDIVERDTISIQIHRNDLLTAGVYTYFLTGDNEVSDTMQMVLLENHEEENMELYQNLFSDDIITIECYIPQTIHDAELQVYNVCGSLIKNIGIPECGIVKMQMNINELHLVGKCTYFLIGDGYVSETMYIILD